MITTIPELLEHLTTLNACSEAKQWIAQQQSVEQAWRDCKLNWKLWYLNKTKGEKNSPTHRRLVGALTEIAESVFHIYEKRYSTYTRIRTCINTSKAYSLGLIDAAAADATYAAAYAAAYAAYAAAAYAAAYAAYAAANAAAANADAAVDANAAAVVYAARHKQQELNHQIILKHYPNFPQPLETK